MGSLLLVKTQYFINVIDSYKFYENYFSKYYTIEEFVFYYLHLKKSNKNNIFYYIFINFVFILYWLYLTTYSLGMTVYFGNKVTFFREEEV